MRSKHDLIMYIVDYLVIGTSYATTSGFAYEIRRGFDKFTRSQLENLALIVELRRKAENCDIEWVCPVCCKEVGYFATDCRHCGAPMDPADGSEPDDDIIGCDADVTHQ